MHYTKFLIMTLELCNNSYMAGSKPTQCYEYLQAAGETARDAGMDKLARNSTARQPEFQVWLTAQRKLERDDCAGLKADPEWSQQCLKGVRYAYERWYTVYLYALKGIQPIDALKLPVGDRK